MKLQTFKYKKLKIEIPEEEDKPILVKWIDESDERVINFFEVDLNSEVEFESLMDEFFQFCQYSKYVWVKRKVLIKSRKEGKEYSGIYLPQKFWRKMGRPNRLLIGFDEARKEIVLRKYED